MHDLCVIVVSHNSLHWLTPALRSVFRHAGPLKMDVVLVDNGCDGAAGRIRAAFPAVRTLRCENRGFAHANNIGLTTASARYVLFLNPDTEILDGRLSDLVETMDSHPSIGLAGVRQLRGDGSLAPSIRRFPSCRNTLGESLGVESFPFAHRLLGERVLHEPAYGVDGDCDWTSGSFMIVRKEALDAVGWLDERFFLFSEETDLCWRLRGAGWRVVHLASMTIRHEESEGWSDCRLEAQAAYARLQFAKKNFSSIGQVLYRGALVFRYLLRVFVYSTLRRRDSAHRAAVKAGLGAVLWARAPFAISR